MHAIGRGDHHTVPLSRFQCGHGVHSNPARESRGHARVAEHEPASATDIDDVGVADINGDGLPDMVVTAGDPDLVYSDWDDVRRVPNRLDDPTIDEVVGSAETFSAIDGLQEVLFVDGNGRVQASPSFDAQIFLAIVFESDASVALPDGVVIALPNDGIVIQHANHDIDLETSWRQTMHAGPYREPPESDLLFGDGFESGDTTEWSSSSSP